MNQISARLTLRACVLVSVFVFLVILALAFAGKSLLPKELADWKKANNELSDGGAIATALVFIPLFFAWAGSLVGLFLFKKWGAWMYLALHAFGTLFALFSPTVESGLAAFFGEWETLLTGFIVGIAFFSNALEPDQNS
jgi:hypothetical protein